MSDYEKHPGGGFSSVDGYQDPAGSQAEEKRRMQEDEQRRRQQDQAAFDSAAEQRSFNAQRAPRHTRADRRPRQIESGKTRSSQASRPAQSGPANPLFAIVGFLIAGYWGLGLLEDDGQWFSGLVVGLLGAYIAGHYYKVLISSALVGTGWWFWINYHPANLSPDQTVSTPSSLSTAVPASQNGSFAPAVPVRQAETPEQKAAAMFPYPAMPALLAKPLNGLIDDPAPMLAFQQEIFSFEKKTGKSFLLDHRSMAPASQSRFDYIRRYSVDGLEEGRELIADLQPTQGIWKYESPQLWELDLIATVKQHFFYQTISPNGSVRDGILGLYFGDGLCYMPIPGPLTLSGDKYQNFRIPVKCGSVWREFVEAVYHAKTAAELLALDPRNLAISQTQRNIAEAAAQYYAQKQAIDEQRSHYLSTVHMPD
ncbi:MAG: hypothetical protein V1706_06330 [Pseudomonadota bacterium]